MAEKWKEYQLQNIEHVFQFECLQAEEEYNVLYLLLLLSCYSCEACASLTPVCRTPLLQHERRSLRDEMANEILDKQKKLEEEKSTMSLRGGAFRCSCTLWRTVAHVTFASLCSTRADGNGDARAVKGRVLRNRRGGKDKDGGYGQAYSRHKTAQRTLLSP